MIIEDEIFKKTVVNYKKLLKYGFKKNNNNYIYECVFFNDDFKAIISIDDKGNVSGKVIDLNINEEYLGLRANINGEFVNKIKESYKDILFDIKNNCFDKKWFIFNQSNRITEYIKDKYDDEPEFLWDKFNGYGVFRKKSNNKWYALIMNLDLSKLDNKSGEVEIINVKLNENKIEKLLDKKGFYKAYHMNKKDWISIILNDTIDDKEIFKLIDESYNLVIK